MRNSRQDRRKQEQLDREQEYRRVIDLNTIDVSPIERQQLVPAASKPIPRVVVSTPLARSNIPLKVLSYSLFLVTLCINASFVFDRGGTLEARLVMSLLGIILEAMLFFLPTQASNLWNGRRWLMSVFASILCLFLFAFAFLASLGFASQNLTEVTTARSERITPAVSDAQRRLEALTASKKDECTKRGDRCRQLERDEQTALEGLRQARDAVSATADPQTASAAKLVAWVTVGRFHPSADDFGMLRLLLLTLLPQLGGLVLMVSSTSRR